MDAIGVTRTAEVTGLDRVGIPNFISVRPREKSNGISYYNGKGVTKSAAQAGALMEAVERYSGEFCDLPVHYCSRQEMDRLGPTVDPGEVIVPQPTAYHPNLQLEWVEGFDLLSRRPTYLPLNAVVYPYEPPFGRPMIYCAGSNGLAAGNTLEEAVCHALCEVIERDAMALSSASLNLAPAVGRLLASVGLADPAPTKWASHDNFSLVVLESLPWRSLKLVGKLRRAGLSVYLRDLTSSLEIPTFDCVIVEPAPGSCNLVHGGSGTHPDARVAVIRALTEAAQSRVAHIQGGREDLPRFVIEPVPFDPDELFGQGEQRPFSEIRSHENHFIDDDIRFILDRLAADGFSHAVAVNLTRPEVGIPVVRIVIPRAETWNVYSGHGRRARFGGRVSEILRSKSSDRIGVGLASWLVRRRTRVEQNLKADASPSTEAVALPSVESTSIRHRALESTSAHSRLPPLVYLGPSLPVAKAEALLVADYRPPVKRGDLPERYDGTVVIIDGEFHQSLSVSPKEILRLLDQGTRVIGASSMGALRAAELRRFGMEGYGWIFESYNSGRIIADDEVALMYTPDELTPLTVPLVNVRYWLHYLETSEYIGPAKASLLFRRARRLFYADRSETRLLAEWASIIGPAEIDQLLLASGGSITDVKAADAELVLRAAL